MNWELIMLAAFIGGLTSSILTRMLKRRCKVSENLDEFVFHVWLHGNWRFLTSKMTTPTKEAAADAVVRYCEKLDPEWEKEDTVDNVDLRWWRE